MNAKEIYNSLSLEERLKDLKEWKKWAARLTGEKLTAQKAIEQYKKNQEIELTEEEIEKLFEAPLELETQYAGIDYARVHSFQDRHIYKYHASGQIGRFQIFVKREEQIKNNH